MTHLLNLIEQYGLWMVFGNIFLEQMGLPLPAYPTLVIAGALLANGHYSVTTLLLTAVLASIIADSIGGGVQVGVMAKKCCLCFVASHYRLIHVYVKLDQFIQGGVLLLY